MLFFAFVNVLTSIIDCIDINPELFDNLQTKIFSIAKKNSNWYFSMKSSKKGTSYSAKVNTLKLF